MKGSIGTKHRCKVCKGKFTGLDKYGMHCPEHDTRPMSYVIFAKPFGFKNPISKTPKGKQLSTYDMAEALLAAIRIKWDDCQGSGDRFKADDFIAKKVALQKFEMKAKEFLDTKDNLWFRETPLISKSEWQGIHNRFKNFITPYFEGKDLRDIDKKDIQRFYNYLIGLKLPDQTSYSRKHIKDICVNLRALFIWEDLTMPKFPIGWNKVIPKKKKKRLSIDDQMKIAPFIPNKHGYKLALNIFNYVPIRPCELRALTVNDVTETGIMVWKSLTDTLKLTTKGDFDEPQHHTLPNYVMDDLRKHIEGKGQDDFIFTIRGNTYSEGALQRMWKRTLIKAGVEHIEFYQAIRHTWASREWKEGQAEILGRIQKKMGHTNKVTATKHYISKG